MGLLPLLGYAVVFAALLGWQAVGLLRSDDTWPTMSDLLREFMRFAPGRYVLFGVWLWVGWHLFVRGWQFPLKD